MKKYLHVFFFLLAAGILIAGCGKSGAQIEQKAVAQSVSPQINGKIAYSWTGFAEKPYGERTGVCVLEGGNIKKYPDISYARWSGEDLMLGFVGHVTREQTYNTLEKIDVNTRQMENSFKIPRGIGRYLILSLGKRMLVQMSEQKNKKFTDNLAILDTQTNELKKITSNPIGEPWLIHGYDFNERNQLIVYSQEDHTKLRSAVIRIINLRGEIIQELPLKGATDPHWSPDGKKIVFVLPYLDYPNSNRANLNITLFDLDSKETERLTKHPGIETQPVFSPDGKQIAYVLWGAGGRANNLAVINIDGTGFQTLLPEDHIRQGQVSNPDWGA